MRILLLVHGFNSLSQRIFVELVEHGHEVSVEFDINDKTLTEAVELFCPEVILAPYLKRAIPENIWKKHICFIVHPGIVGDRGPSAVDWAILRDEAEWGVTVLQAESKMDAGPVWASVTFPMRKDTKSSLYRNEVTEAAVQAVHTALERLTLGDFEPQYADCTDSNVKGREYPTVRQTDRSIDWDQDDTEIILRKVRSADGVPGVADNLFGRALHIYDARPAPYHSGVPGEVIARSGPAVCRATTDGAVWIGHVSDKNTCNVFKRPACDVLQEHLVSIEAIPVDSEKGYREIWYEKKGLVGFLNFDFYNGAMGTDQCERLLAAYKTACEQSTKVIILMGGKDFWSNGMHLNLIEAAPSAADESWRNINAIDDLAEAIINTRSQLTVAALQGNAGAGGVFLARASDHVWLREGIILNPHYKDMGNLYGSEYWTYLLPRYAGEENAETIIQARLPMGTREAVLLGLGDECFERDRRAFALEVEKRAHALAESADFDVMLEKKNRRRDTDEAARPLSDYRNQELSKMRSNFYGFDPSYHIARYNFVHKIPKSRTPITIARHRAQQYSHNHRQAS